MSGIFSNNSGLLDLLDYTGALILIVLAASGILDKTTSIVTAITGLITFIITLISELLKNSTIQNKLSLLLQIQQSTDILIFQIQFGTQFYNTVILGTNNFPTIIQTFTNPPANIILQRINDSYVYAVALNTVIQQTYAALPTTAPATVLQIAQLLVIESQAVVDAFVSSNALAIANMWAADPSNIILQAQLLNAVALYLIPANVFYGTSQGLTFVLDALIFELQSSF